MTLLKNAMQVKAPASLRGLFIALLTLLVALMPGFALAGEGDVVLKFTSADNIYLYISLVFGVLALAFGAALASKVLKQDPGTPKMQEVSRAVEEGALAYLRQQIRTMLIFVVLIAVGLFFMFGNNALISLTFILGVAASYGAGFAGMLMAVKGNCRTAGAALTSNKKALETAFHSGAVAGMLTVGMGLIGATLILLLAQDQAMQLLIGFGFGGSLAALFMRVGGGIFTKAADVGADLVGKVEAGIPEDDPRNPATIADNVGDNVGDCAGMAADIFESYEVTLVAAIVLGAATASIFDTSTWMKLILFALMARGVGIIASGLGILFLKGDDNVDSDPLKSIRRGFYFSAVIAAIATFGLAWFMMGGKDAPIVVNKLVSYQQLEVSLIQTVDQVRQELADKTGKPNWQVATTDLAADPRIKALGFTSSQEDMGMLNQLPKALADGISNRLPPTDGFHIADPNDLNDKALDDAAQNPMRAAATDPAYVKVRELAKAGLVFAKLSGTFQPAPTPATKTMPASQPPAQPINLWVGPVAPSQLQSYVDMMKKRAAGQPGSTLNMDVPKTTYPVTIYEDRDGNLLLGAAHIDGKVMDYASQIHPLTYYKASVDDMSKQIAGASQPDPQQTAIAEVQQSTVPWYMFALAITFGILMAFAIEYLTDYYVSTHKKPVQEVAGVSSAGAAPMIIQGFAYAAESSVFMVFAIVIALMMPIFFFPQALILSFYGIALVGLGLLTTTGYVLAMDTFGPISDNAQGVYEMAGDFGENEYGSKVVQRLDAAGNTTKALTKGFAIATAVVAAVALFHSYLESARLEGVGLRLDIPEIFLGLLIGGAAPYLFSATTINAVGRAAFELINEVRRQFRSDSGILAGTSKPDYGRCVAIVTAAAQKELLGPAILAIFLPIAVVFGFSIGKAPVSLGGHLYDLVGAEALGGFLAGAILSGQLMAVLLANSGGMWDNAKKLIEDGLFGGKGSDAHKAAVVCDTVGDPFKDTAGPAMNPLIKVMNLVALLMAPIFIQHHDPSVQIGVTAVAVAILAGSIYWSKRGSMSESMASATGAPSAEDVKEMSETASSEMMPEEVVKPKRKIKVEEPEDPKPEE